MNRLGRSLFIASAARSSSLIRPPATKESLYFLHRCCVQKSLTNSGTNRIKYPKDTSKHTLVDSPSSKMRDLNRAPVETTVVGSPNDHYHQHAAGEEADEKYGNETCIR